MARVCDSKDGVRDGLIFDTRDCHFDPAELVCKGRKTDTCLSAKQVAALQKVFAGPKNSRGEALYSDWPYDTGIAAPGWRALKLGTSQTATPNSADVTLMFSGLNFFFTPPDPQFDPMKFNFDTDPARLNETSVLQDSLLTFLSTFSARASKLMLIHGMSDPFFSAYDTARYYERVVRDNGGLDKTMPWVRFFEVPGMNHCGGGPALDDFDPLTALVEWTEKDQAPEHMVRASRFQALAGPCAPILHFRIIAESVRRTTQLTSSANSGSALDITPLNSITPRPTASVREDSNVVENSPSSAGSGAATGQACGIEQPAIATC